MATARKRCRRWSKQHATTVSAGRPSGFPGTPALHPPVPHRCSTCRHCPPRTHHSRCQRWCRPPPLPPPRPLQMAPPRRSAAGPLPPPPRCSACASCPPALRPALAVASSSPSCRQGRRGSAGGRVRPTAQCVAHACMTCCGSRATARLALPGAPTGAARGRLARLRKAAAPQVLSTCSKAAVAGSRSFQTGTTMERQQAASQNFVVGAARQTDEPVVVAGGVGVAAIPWLEGAGSGGPRGWAGFACALVQKAYGRSGAACNPRLGAPNGAPLRRRCTMQDAHTASHGRCQVATHAHRLAGRIHPQLVVKLIRGLEKLQQLIGARVEHLRQACISRAEPACQSGGCCVREQAR